MVRYSLLEIYEMENQKQSFCGIPANDIVPLQVQTLSKKRTVKELYNQITIQMKRETESFRKGFSKKTLYIVFIEEKLYFSEDEWNYFFGRNYSVHSNRF